MNEERAQSSTLSLGQYQRRGYDVVSVEMHSPLTVVLELPPEAVPVFGFALLVLAERIATSQTRVSARRAKDLRDKAAYERERRLIEEGRLDMAMDVLRRYPRPSTIDIVGGEESFAEAEPIEPLFPDLRSRDGEDEDPDDYPPPELVG